MSLACGQSGREGLDCGPLLSSQACQIYKQRRKVKVICMWGCQRFELEAYALKRGVMYVDIYRQGNDGPGWSE